MDELNGFIMHYVSHISLFRKYFQMQPNIYDHLCTMCFIYLTTVAGYFRPFITMPFLSMRNYLAESADTH